MIQFYLSNSVSNIFEVMNEELRKVAVWFKANKLSWIFPKQNALYFVLQEKGNI